MAADRTYHVYSKLANSQIYTQHVQGGGDLPIVASSVHIKGGAGLASKHIVTPLGVHTEITEAELEALKLNKVFQQHFDNGFIKIEAKKVDIDKIVSDMTSASDPSAPLTETDYPETGNNGVEAKVKVRKAKD